MRKRTVSGVLLALLLVGMLFASFEIGRASASPSVRIYVDMPPQGYIPGIPVGQVLKVTINVESPAEWGNTANGIVGWALFARVDPEVLEPLTVNSAMSGYFLYDFAQTHGYSTNVLYTIDKEAGIFWDVCEFIQGYGTLGVGAGGDGKLCELWFKSKSQTAYSPIDIYLWRPDSIGPPEYCTPDGWWHSFEIVEDGHYNVLELPAAVDFDPDTLNLRSRGRWIACHVELPDGYDVSDIDVSTVMLNEAIPVSLLDVPAPDPVPMEIGDYDDDGIPDLLVMFDRAMVSEYILSNPITDDYAALTITGEVAGMRFRGEDSIKVIPHLYPQETVRFYVQDPADGDNVYIGVAPPPPFPPPPPNLEVIVMIESPYSWMGTSDGIAAFMVSVRVDPRALKVVGISPAGDIDGDGYTDDFLEMYAQYLQYNGYSVTTIQAPEATDRATGTIWGYASALTGADWSPLLGGAGGDAFTGDNIAALCKIQFVTNSATHASLIDLMGPGTIAEQVVAGIEVSCKYANALGDIYTVEPEDGYYVDVVDTMYLDCSAGYDPAAPLYTDWHELAPLHCQWWMLESWDDNGDAVLSESDQVDMICTDGPNSGFSAWYHVEWVNPVPVAGDGKADVIIKR